MAAAAIRKSKSRGRPPKEDTADIRKQIMESAIDLFASQGYAATSIRAIANRVGVNPAMIHYYFGRKEKLLHAALEQSLEPLAAAIAAMQDRHEAPLQNVVALILDAFRKRPSLPVLMTREVMLPGGAVQEHFIKNFAPRLGGALPRLLREEQKNKRLRDDLDPRLVAQTLLGLCAFPFVSRSLAEPVMGIAYDEVGLQKIEQHITQLLRQGFCQ